MLFDSSVNISRHLDANSADILIVSVVELSWRLRRRCINCMLLNVIMMVMCTSFDQGGLHASIMVGMVLMMMMSMMVLTVVIHLHRFNQVVRPIHVVVVHIG